MKEVRMQGENLILVPMISTAPEIPPLKGPVSKQIEKFALLMANDLRQMRVNIEYNPTVALAADYRALDMVENNYFGHTDLNGFGPDHHARRFGVKLPDFYPNTKNANHIESIVKNIRDAEHAWEVLMNSPDHERHILGLHNFFAEQTQVGIGMVLQKSEDPKVILYTMSILTVPDWE